MQIALSTHLVVNHRLTTIWLERIWNAGFPLVEVFCARQHLDYQDKAQLGELAYWFRDSALKLHSVHSPMYSDEVWGRSGPQSVINISHPLKSKRRVAVEEVKRALEIADHIPFRYLVQHLGVSGDEFSEEKMDAAFSSLEEIRLFAGQRGVEVLLENTPNDLASAHRLQYFLGFTHLRMNYCFDIGHAHMTGNLLSEFEAMADRIRSTHIHDNDGKNDLHAYPLEGKGTVDWLASMKMLASRPNQYPLLLELREPPDIEHPIEYAKRKADQLLALN
ncbi:MAG: sugar phosphate isomerase/epimerase family protein [Bryobacteraceae bacterium]